MTGKISDRIPFCILHRRPFQAKGLLVDAISSSARFSFVAYGAHEGGKRSRQLQPFSVITADFYESEPCRLSSIESIQTCSLQSKWALNSGFYLNELTQLCTYEGLNTFELFSAYRSAIEHISSGELFSAVREYEIEVLRFLGCLPDFEQDVSGVEIQPHASYRWISEIGFERIFQAESGSFLGRDILSVGQKMWTMDRKIQQRNICRAIVASALDFPKWKSVANLVGENR